MKRFEIDLTSDDAVSVLLCIAAFSVSYKVIAKLLYTPENR